MKANILYLVGGFVLALIVLKRCEPEPIVKTEIRKEIVKVTDTVTKTIIEKVPEQVFVEKLKTVKGKDSIVYRNQPTDSTISANKYNTKIESNNATADLEITTTGELLDVQGVINFTQSNTTIETIEKHAQSGLFIYGETSINNPLQRIEIGLDYQFKNQFIIGLSGSYNDLVKSGYINLKFGVKLL